MVRNGMIIEKDGSIRWYLNGSLHRDNGPAVEFPNGSKWWIKSDLPHRLEGPANSNNGYEEWWINGERFLKEEHPFNVFRNQYNLSKDYEDWPNDMKMLFKLTYG